MKKIMLAFAIVTTIVSCKNKKEATDVKAKGHDEQLAEMFPAPKVDIKTVGILLYDGYSTLDAMGPYNVLGELMGTNVFFVGLHKGLVADGRGMKVQVDTSIDEVKHLDILVIPGGFKETYELTKDTNLLNWIRAIDSSSVYTTSVCTGAWILGATGVLKGKEATTHWWGKKILAAEFGAKVQQKRYVRSGKYWTSAGITAGMDMGLALINEIRGENYTKAIMLDLEYDPQPIYKGGSDYNTDTTIVNAMRTMYDMGMEKVLHPVTTYENIKFDNNKDPFCGMPITTGVVDTVHYNGKIYGFCSKGCKDGFMKDPAAYAGLYK
ncbi:DJ-1/PfpI family protein [Chitinophaga sancti]|uniref:DJ-1/PfpI family protein n=1 Tax=Chitinophaga sancti TaxID=1004 RepID=UPI002A74AC92|nr:DJ-1/PfpI family protein [Chitinophaga sancti]WPQ60671.1 DJ-1/PfpI family protein [Chitinophaga sancti]